MKLKAFIKRIIDAAMLLLLPVLMAEPQTGEVVIKNDHNFSLTL